MGAILEQLGLDKTFFYQLAVFAVLFILLSRIYFRPFLKLFEARRKRTIEDAEAAAKLMSQAEARFDEYKKRLADERGEARREYEKVLTEARKEEAEILAHAREEAKKATQEAAESVALQRDQLKKQLEADVDVFAKTISEKLLARKV